MPAKGKKGPSDEEMERENHFARKNIPAVFHMLASSDDHQESEEVYNVGNDFRLPDPAGLEGGACTAALLQALYRDNRADETVSWVAMLRRMREHLESINLQQTPQLSSSRVIDVNKPMYIVPPGCQGNKRAMLVGINYVGQQGELRACHNDVNNVKDFLINGHGFKERDMLILVDDGQHYEPTRKNIMNGFAMLVEKSQPGDVVFVQFSGHGGQIGDQDGDESDGFDETIIPVDFKEEGQIVDDDILRFFVQPMSYGVHATVLMDCCHSGSVLDLPYMCGPNEDAMVLEDLNEHRTYESLLERIQYNDKELGKLILDQPNHWIVEARREDFGEIPWDSEYELSDSDEDFTDTEDGTEAEGTEGGTEKDDDDDDKEKVKNKSKDKGKGKEKENDKDKGKEKSKEKDEDKGKKEGKPNKAGKKDKDDDDSDRSEDSTSTDGGLPDEYNFKYLNIALRKNFTIQEIYIANDFLNAYTSREIKKLLASMGHCEDLELLSIDGAKPLTFEQLDYCILKSKNLRTIKVTNVHFQNTGQDYQAFVKGLIDHPTVKKYTFNNCYFANKTERPPYVPRMKGKIKAQCKAEEKKQKERLAKQAARKKAHLH